MSGKNITIVGKGQVMSPVDWKSAADAERERCRTEGFDEGLKQGRHEAHHARKYVLAGVYALGLIMGFCGGVGLAVTITEGGMSKGVMIGGAIARAEDQRPQGGLRLRDQYTREGE